MATGAPLNRITLGAASVADDLGFVALADVAHGRRRSGEQPGVPPAPRGDGLVGRDRAASDEPAMAG
jgi:hypothetical protein